MNPEILLLIFRVLMALVLYGFFGFALYLIWRSLPKPTTIDSLIPEIYALEYQGEVLIHGHRLKAVNLCISTSCQDHLHGRPVASGRCRLPQRHFRE
jgi:hypothetical protein